VITKAENAIETVAHRKTVCRFSFTPWLFAHRGQPTPPFRSDPLKAAQDRKIAHLVVVRAILEEPIHQCHANFGATGSVVVCTLSGAGNLS
jgi:hypothetical protein